MESELTYRFFTSCAPAFFSQELLKVLSSPTPSSTEFLQTIDSLIALLSTNHIPLPTIIPKAFTLLPLSSLQSTFHKKAQFILNFELLRADPTSCKVKAITKLGRSLCMQMALENDSSAFNRFYITDVLPRYVMNIPQSLLLEIAEEFELEEETKEFLDASEAKDMPKKRKYCKSIEADKISPVRRSPRLNNINYMQKDKKKAVAVNRCLSGAVVKKQINIKGVSRVINSTPEPPHLQISIEAKRLREFNQIHFYDKKESKALEVVEADSEEVGLNEVKVLVMSTPTKEKNNKVYEIREYKNIFNV